MAIHLEIEEYSIHQV